MYTKALRADIICAYSGVKSVLSNVFRWQYPHGFNRPLTKAKFPGPNHLKAMEAAQATNT